LKNSYTSLPKSSYDKNSSNPTQRALILQGGGALGAYEIGALQEFCRSLALENDTNSNRREN